MSKHSHILRGTAVAAAALLLTVGGVSAQEPDLSPEDQTQEQAPTPAPAPVQIPDSIRAMLQELQELQGRLTSLQQEAIQQSDELQAEQASVEETLQEAMENLNPELEDDIDRMEELQQEMAEAQGAEDQERVMSLSSEARTLRGELQEAQSQAMQQPEVQDEMESFQELLVEEMISIDSETEDLIARLDVLIQRFQEYQQNQTGQGSPPSPPNEG